jgi:hypothetical protein
LLSLADRYVKEAAKRRKAADAAKPGTAKADAALAKAEKAVVDAKTRLLQLTNDPAAVSSEQLRAATAATKRVEEAYRAAKKKHRAQTSEYRMRDQAATAYTQYARMVQTHVARVEITIHCKADLGCYGATLNQSEADLLARIKPYVPDIETWTREEKQGVVDASIERAMLELGKRGAAAADLTDALLDAATSDHRIVRESILLALPHIAKLPCARCVTKLDRAIKAGEGKTTLDALNLETSVLRNYFRWAR